MFGNIQLRLSAHLCKHVCASPMPARSKTSARHLMQLTSEYSTRVADTPQLCAAHKGKEVPSLANRTVAPCHGQSVGDVRLPTPGATVRRPLVFVPMAADLLHAGHINILNISGQLGRVVVGLVSDEGIRKYKREPILTYENRKALLDCLKQVDEVIKIESVQYAQEEQILALQPDFFVHGTDWAHPSSPQFKPRAELIEVMKAWDGQVIEPAYTEGVSTSEIIKRCAAVAAATEKAAVKKASHRTLQEVYYLVPNQIDYLRLIMGLSPLVIPLQYYPLSAGLYFGSHLLDLVDGKVARMLNQTSHFGVVLDYSVDIITSAVFMLKMCSLPGAPALYVIPCSTVIAVETAGLVLAVNASASGQYWKGTDAGTPYVLRELVIKDGKYTNLGFFSVAAHQGTVALAWMMVFDPCSTWLGLMAAMAPFTFVNFWANTAIVYEMLRKWKEPAN